MHPSIGNNHFIKYRKVCFLSILHLYSTQRELRAIRSSMELLSATMQKNALVMADTTGRVCSMSFLRSNLQHHLQETSAYLIAGGLVMILRSRRTKNLGTWWGRLVLPKWWWLRQANPGEGAADDACLLDPSDSFSDPEQPLSTPSTLDMAMADFKVEETTGPSLSEAMALRVHHMKTPLLPEKLKLSIAPLDISERVQPISF